MLDDNEYSQYSSVKPLLTAADEFTWVPESERARIAAYNKYEQIYFSEERAFQLMRRGTELQPLVVPQPRTIVDSTSHYLLKGLTLESKGAVEKALTPFLKRERFNSRFVVAKHSGVTRGDWLMHITADPDEEDGRRVSMTTVDPSSYFPIYDDDDLDKLVKVYLAEVFRDSLNSDRLSIKRLSYEIVKEGGKRRIKVEEGIYDADPKKWVGNGAPLLRQTIPEDLLPEEITAIPVYHFKNWDWQGQPYGSSELRGFERIQSSINQTLTDEELALALEGLGVYATDGGPPTDDQGNELNWEISPARVMEVATGAYFKRVEGVNSVTPMLDHAKFLRDEMYEASGVFRAGVVDVQVAESGIALAIRFIPTMAKLEERDQAGIDVLNNMWFDWTFWMDSFEGTNIGGQDVTPVLGEKLPLNRNEVITELNNMLDRHVISGAYYRSQMTKLFGYQFPSDEEMTNQIVAEQTQWAAFKSNIDTSQENEQGLNNGDPKNPNAPTKPQSNGSNNKGRTNESDGNEARHTPQRQQRSGRA